MVLASESMSDLKERLSTLQQEYRIRYLKRRAERDREINENCNKDWAYFNSGGKLQQVADLKARLETLQHEYQILSNERARLQGELSNVGMEMLRAEGAARVLQQMIEDASKETEEEHEPV